MSGKSVVRVSFQFGVAEVTDVMTAWITSSGRVR